MCISGYWHVRNLSREQIDTLSDDIGNGLSPQYLKRLTKEYNLIIVAGLIQKAPNGALYNTYVAAQPDGCVHSHRKLHCFISRHMSSHQDYTDFDSHLGVRIGILVCYDNNLVENASKGPTDANGFCAGFRREPTTMECSFFSVTAWVGMTTN